MRVLARGVLAVGGVGVACVTYGVLIERRWYRLRHLTLPGTLRPEAGPQARLRILQVSDLHLSPGQEHRVRFVASLADLDHDLVVASGDLLGGVGQEDRTVAALAPLTDGRPGLAVLGSNDFFGPVPKSPSRYFLDPRHRLYGPRLDTGRLVRGLGQVGYRTLRNERCTLATPIGPVAVAGLDDPHLDTTALPPTDDVRSTDPDAVLRLGLVHAPYQRALDLLVEAGHEVLLAGHTHGGQVRLPGVGALTANCDLPLRQARGLSHWRGRFLHVSPGLGHSPYAPFRFACRPEATLLDLTA